MSRDPRGFRNNASQRFEEQLLMKSHVRRLQEAKSALKPRTPSNNQKPGPSIDRLLKVYEPVTCKHPQKKTPSKPLRTPIPEVIRRHRAGLPPLNNQITIPETQCVSDKNTEEDFDTTHFVEDFVDEMLVQLPTNLVHGQQINISRSPQVKERGRIRNLRPSRSTCSGVRPQSLASVIPRSHQLIMDPEAFNDHYSRPSNLAELRAVKAAVNSIIREEAEKEVFAAIEDEQKALSNCSSADQFKDDILKNSSNISVEELGSTPGPTPHWILNKLHHDMQLANFAEESVALVKDASDELDDWYFSEQSKGLAAHSALYTLVQGLEEIHQTIKTLTVEPKCRIEVVEEEESNDILRLEDAPLNESSHSAFVDSSRKSSITIINSCMKRSDRSNSTQQQRLSVVTPSSSNVSQRSVYPTEFDLGVSQISTCASHDGSTLNVNTQNHSLNKVLPLDIPILDLSGSKVKKSTQLTALGSRISLVKSIVKAKEDRDRAKDGSMKNMTQEDNMWSTLSAEVFQ